MIGVFSIEQIGLPGRHLQPYSWEKYQEGLYG
jgi:hypothetical protein